MQTILESAHTWFFDSLNHDLSDVLEIRLVEGIKASERQVYNVCGTMLGPHFPVSVEQFSRCVLVRFKDVLSFFIYNESYDTTDPELKEADNNRFLLTLETSSFRKFTDTTINISKIYPRSYHVYLLWCEDRVFQVLTEELPEIPLLEDTPDLSIERTMTWAAN